MEQFSRKEKIFFLVIAIIVAITCLTEIPEWLFSKFNTTDELIVVEKTETTIEPAVTPTFEPTPQPSSTPMPIVEPTPEVTIEPTPEPTLIPAWDRSYTGDGLPEFLNRNEDLLEIIKECKEYYAENGFNYCMCSGKRRIPPETSFKTSCSEHKVRGSYVTDCSTYVSWVLHEYGVVNQKKELAEYFSSQRNSGTFHKFGRENGGQFFEVIHNYSDCKPGDILVYSGHVEFFQTWDSDGRAIVWSCGSGKYVNHGYPERASRTTDKIVWALRLKV